MEELNKKAYSLKYPKSWTLTELPSAKKKDALMPELVLMGPAVSPSDEWRENITLITEDFSAHGATAEQYLAASEANIELVITKGEDITVEKVERDGTSFHKTIYPSEDDIVIEQYYFIKGQKAYILTLSCKEASVERCQENGEKILDSFALH